MSVPVNWAVFSTAEVAGPGAVPILHTVTERTERTLHVRREVAEAAYRAYVREFGGGDQTLDQVASRGGFSVSELITFLAAEIRWHEQIVKGMRR